ncbi:BrnT family toxin [Coleofasciculus sp. H7-2]|uniref:BrnT family toxin n=1 Tax=Coleofasciculus sp. H7-2 TaxID=3351545 RepID=UPI00366CC766
MQLQGVLFRNLIHKDSCHQIQAITIFDDHPDEERFVTIGMNGLGQILVVVYTYREEKIPIISARKTTKSKRKMYEE